MCTMIVEQALIAGSGRGRHGGFPLKGITVSYDHPFHAPLDHAINIDFVNEDQGIDARVAVELTPASARALIQTIENALDRGRHEGLVS